MKIRRAQQLDLILGTQLDGALAELDRNIRWSMDDFSNMKKKDTNYEKLLNLNRQIEEDKIYNEVQERINAEKHAEKTRQKTVRDLELLYVETVGSQFRKFMRECEPGYRQLRRTFKLHEETAKLYVEGANPKRKNAVDTLVRILKRYNFETQVLESLETQILEARKLALK